MSTPQRTTMKGATKDMALGHQTGGPRRQPTWGHKIILRGTVRPLPRRPHPTLLCSNNSKSVFKLPNNTTNRDRRTRQLVRRGLLLTNRRLLRMKPGTLMITSKRYPPVIRQNAGLIGTILATGLNITVTTGRLTWGPLLNLLQLLNNNHRLLFRRSPLPTRTRNVRINRLRAT